MQSGVHCWRRLQEATTTFCHPWRGNSFQLCKGGIHSSGQGESAEAGQEGIPGLVQLQQATGLREGLVSLYSIRRPSAAS